MAVQDLGHEAISLTGSQAGIVTDTVHGKAKISEIRATRINDALDAGKIVLVAGFQGVSADSHDVTTLGRGGSNLTAVALAAALGASACEMYTDVEGVYTADPRLVPTARKLNAVTYEEMLELAASGAKVLQLRSVEFARNHNVRLHVRSTFSDAGGTWIVDEEDPVLEKAIISGVAHTDCEPLYRVSEIEAARLFDSLAEANVNVDTILQVTGGEIVFSAPVEDRDACKELLAGLGVDWSMRDDLGKVALVGAGMKSHPGIAAKTFATLEEIGVKAEVISTSPIKIACHVATGDVPKAVAALHDAFELGNDRRADRRRWRDRRRGNGELRLLRERGYENVRRCVGALGGNRPRRRLSRGSDTRRARRRRHRPRALLLRHERLARPRPPRRRRRRARRRQVERVPARRGLPARRARSERTSRAHGARLDARRREPELLDDPAHVRAQAAARRRRPSLGPRLDVPGRLGRGRAADGAAPR